MGTEGPLEPAPSDAEDLFAHWLAQNAALDFDSYCRAHSHAEPELRELWRDWQRLRSLRAKADPEGAPAQAPASAILRRLGSGRSERSRYQPRGEIARGAMGAILRVWDEDLQRDLAMKVILGQAQARPSGETPPVPSQAVARFLEEAQITGQLDHPGIVPVHELGVDANGRVFFTMKLVQGRDLKTIFELVAAAQEGWNETRALGVLLKVCEALAYAHSKGVIHRDLKPSNVMVGSFGEVYVMDWGLARVLDRADTRDIRIRREATPSSVHTERRSQRASEPDSSLLTMDGDVLGTPSYMPPEQAHGEIERMGPRSDVYAVGAMLYHLLTGRAPYSGSGEASSPYAVLLRVIAGDLPPIEGLRPAAPRELVAICRQAMARQPDERYADIQALAEDLRAHLEGRVVRAHDTSVWMQARKWVARNRRLAASLAAVLGLGLTALALRNAARVEAAQRATLESESRTRRLVASLEVFQEGDLLAEVDPARRAEEYRAALEREAIELFAPDPLASLQLQAPDDAAARRVVLDAWTRQAKFLAAAGFAFRPADQPAWARAEERRAWADNRARHLRLEACWPEVRARIEALEPEAWRRRLWDAWVSWWLERVDRSAALMAEAAAQERSAADIEWLAELVHEIHGPSRAAPLYRSALEREPERFWCHMRLTVATAGLERAQHFVHALESRRSNVAWYNLALSLQAGFMSAQDLEIAGYQRSIALDPLQPQPYANLSLLLPKEEGLAVLMEFVETGSGSVDCYVNLTKLASELGRNEDWVHYAEEGVARFSASGKLRFNLARAYDHTGRLEEALEQYEATAELGDEASWDAHTNAAGTLQGLAFSGPAEADDPRLLRAAEHYQRALELRPQDPVSHFNVAVALISTVHIAEALDELERLAQLAPDYSRLPEALSTIHAFVSATPGYAEHLPRVEAWLAELSED